MFPKTQRMTREEFSSVFKNGVHTHSSFFHVVTLPVTDRPEAAVVVSKKVHKTAILRNRLRRRLYAALRTVVNTTSTPYAIIVIAKKPAIESSYQTLITALKDQLARNTKQHVGRML